MTTTYTLQDGGKITATCAADFVTKLVRAAVSTASAPTRNTCTILPTDSTIRPGT